MSRLDELLHKEMTRQQFLATLGVGIASIFGFSAIMGLLTEGDKSENNTPSDYGDRNYGS